MSLYHDENKIFLLRDRYTLKTDIPVLSKMSVCYLAKNYESASFIECSNIPLEENHIVGRQAENRALLNVDLMSFDKAFPCVLLVIIGGDVFQNSCITVEICGPEGTVKQTYKINEAYEKYVVMSAFIYNGKCWYLDGNSIGDEIALNDITGFEMVKELDRKVKATITSFASQKQMGYLCDELSESLDNLLSRLNELYSKQAEQLTAQKKQLSLYGSSGQRNLDEEILDIQKLIEKAESWSDPEKEKLLEEKCKELEALVGRCSILSRGGFTSEQCERISKMLDLNFDEIKSNLNLISEELSLARHFIKKTNSH